ncbi:MAG: DNA mismatch repair endonuclease MutL [Lentisphaerae bacterium]|nr:MAG: DNA mismatch repair endonuclease MutL [Lentisphaerota bacterium]
MSKIRILDEDVSNRIAAGEVIERPASVVKELVDNALDAGARHIQVHIENGGKSLIRVTDDGCGMDQEDALLCLEAHATSKITSADDLVRISTMGFRGEAIPSIASVSIFTLMTRLHEATEGTRVHVEGGVIKTVEACGCPPGTSVTVKRLFYNMPARRKFLRTNNTEEHHIQQMMMTIAIAHPQIGFQLSMNKRTVFDLGHQQDLKTRVAMLLGRGLMQEMLPVDYREDDLHIYGFIAKPGLSRSSRRDQYLFVNGRPVQDLGIQAAVRDAYHSLIMKGRYPPLVLFLEMPPEQVDINVHPAKKEVRFRDGRLVNRVTAKALRLALQDFAVSSSAFHPPSPESSPSPVASGPPPSDSIHQSLIAIAHGRRSISPTGGRSPSTPAKPATSRASAPPSSAQSTTPPQRSPEVTPDRSVPEPPDQETETASTAPDLLETNVPDEPAPAHSGTTTSAASAGVFARIKILAVLSASYILGETDEGLILIDQHAAHERILYERFMNNVQHTRARTQGMLIPFTIELTPAEGRIVRERRDALREVGFEIEHFGGDTFLVTAVPVDFPQENLQTLISDLLAELSEHTGSPKNINEEAIILAACKAAVKAHDKIRIPEIEALLRDLAACELPYTCPHGRPTMIQIPFSEIERRFGRRAPSSSNL